MIGQHVETRRRLPWGSLLLLAGGFTLVGWGVTEDARDWIVAAALPLAVGLTTLGLGRPRPFVARFTAEAIELGAARDFAHDVEPTVIPYESLRAIRAEGRATAPAAFRNQSSPLHVEHEGGSFWIPARLNVASAEVFRFLADQLPRDGTRDVNPILVPYLRRQEDQHGAEAVRSYRAAAALPHLPVYRGVRAVALGVMLAGLIWIGAGLAGLPGVATRDWVGGGAIALTTGSILGLITFAQMPILGRRIPRWRQASLVLAPDGLAMVQGPIQGEIHWGELQAIRFVPRPRAFRGAGHSAMLPGIHMKVQGATITIADLYERPLYLLFEEIRAVAPPHLIDGKTVPAEAEPL